MSDDNKPSDRPTDDCASCPDDPERRTNGAGEPDATDSSGTGLGSATRRRLLGTTAALSATSLAGCIASSDDDDENESSNGEPNETENEEKKEYAATPVPDVEGPITGGAATGRPQLSAVPDLAEYGYVEEEYFVSGKARSFEAIAGESDDTAEYTTRVVVWRPAHRAHFNGTLLADWPNVTTQIDVPVTWINAYDYLMREGYAVAMISAQEVGVQDSAEDMDLVTWDPERYGDLHHPGDDYAFDVFSQAIAALQADAKQRGEDPDPLDGLEPERTLATGMSQSAYYLHTYVNAVQERLGLIDGFLPAAAGTIIDDVPVRADVAPVLWLNTEDESDDEPRPDEGQFRLWEVAGASHVNRWLSAYTEVAIARDFEGETVPWNPTIAGQYGEREDGVYGECEYNYFPVRYAYRAALDALNEWVATGEEPPTAPRIERTTGDDGELEVVRDEYGNAVGGLRLPPIDVPVAHYDATSCELFGRTFRFDEKLLGKLYPTHDDYTDAMAAAIDEAVANGYLLPRDAADLQRRAEDAPIGRD